MASTVFLASCLCGEVRYRLTGNLAAPRYCHCSNCVKFSGSAPAAWAMAQKADLILQHPDQEETAVGRFNSGKGIRCFCNHCGTPVWFESFDYPSIVGIPLGVIDKGDIPRPEVQLWTDSAPSWCQLIEGLPKHTQGPDSALKSK